MPSRVACWFLFVSLLSLPAWAKPSAVAASTLKDKPTIDEGKITAVFLWTDGEGLHLRWTTDGKPVLFSGRLDMDKKVGELKTVRDEAGGWANLHGDRIVVFSKTSRGTVDGLDLKIPGVARVALELKLDGQDPLPEQVLLGGKATQPASFPLLLSLR